MIDDVADARELWAAIRAMQDSIEHIREHMARLVATAATVLPVTVLGSAPGAWTQSSTARHLDHASDRLVVAVRTLSEVERRTTDSALRQMCRDALERVASIQPDARADVAGYGVAG